MTVELLVETDTCDDCGCASHKGESQCFTVVACSGRRCIPGHPGADHRHLCICPA